MKSAFPRKRAVQACRMCRHRRTKCDNGRPSCSMCLTLGVECVYGDTSEVFDPGSIAILKRLDGLEQLIRAGKTENKPRATSSSGLSAVGSPSMHAPNLGLTARGANDAAEYRYHVNVESMLQWPVFESQNIDQRVDLKTLFDPVRGENFGLQWSPSDPVIQSGGIDEALQRYLDQVNVFNPIFEEDHPWDMLRRVRSEGLGWNAESCLILLACAVGAVSERSSMTEVESSIDFRSTAAFHTAELYFFSAQKRMGPLLCDRSVIAAQCFFLAGYYFASTMRPLDAWRLLIQSLACCQGHPDTVDVEQAERNQAQQRLYWAVFKSELEMCLELDLAQDSINNLAYPTFFPSPPDSLATQLRVGWYFHLSDIAIRRLKNRSLNYIYHCERSHISVSEMTHEIINLEKEAEGLYTMLPPELQPGTRDIEEELDQPRSILAKMRVELQMHLLDCYEIMYWPFIVNLVSDEARDETTSLAFASKAISIAIDRIQKSRGRHRHRQYASWLILRRSTRSALLLFAANLTPQLKQILPPQWKSAAFTVIEMLRYWADELKDVRNRLSILEKLMRNVENSDSGAMEIV